MSVPSHVLPAACLDALTAQSATVATAESLTAGLVSATLASVAGASEALRGGVVAYASDLKVGMLGVDGALVAKAGVISSAVAEQMAAGVCDRMSADWGVATTGVAGPDPQDGHPPGEVYVAVAGPGGLVDARALRLTGDRQAIRTATVDAALTLLLSHLRGEVQVPPAFLEGRAQVAVRTGRLEQHHPTDPLDERNRP